MRFALRPMTIRDYAEVIHLWQSAEGVHAGEDDSRRSISSFLRRNPGMSLVAQDGRQLVGAVLCGHDGRRGYLHHLAVAPSHRREGIGRALVERCLAKLHARGVRKCRILVLSGNRRGRAFWRALGWVWPPEVTLMMKNLDEEGC